MRGYIIPKTILLGACYGVLLMGVAFADRPNSKDIERNHQNSSTLPMNADQQSNSKASIQVTRKIRTALTDRKDLSTAAHNVKVITNDGGVVTLRGEVASAAERSAIAQLAMRIVGERKVQDEMEVSL